MGSLYRAFLNTRMRTKVAAVIAVTALTGVMAMALAHVAFRDIQTETRHLSMDMVPELNTLNQTEADLQQLRVDLYQAIAAARAGMTGEALRPDGGGQPLA